MSSSEARLRWTGEKLVFRGSANDGPEIAVDSDNVVGTSPTGLLLLSLAGCMAVDVVMILEKSRVPVTALEVVVDGDRAADPPRKFEALRLTYRVSGPDADHDGKLERAVDLSRDKYCSVLHTLRPDLTLDIRIERG
jgi:putative redox protein